jgi:hypothetical protein
VPLVLVTTANVVVLVEFVGCTTTGKPYCSFDLRPDHAADDAKGCAGIARNCFSMGTNRQSETTPIYRLPPKRENEKLNESDL